MMLRLFTLALGMLLAVPAMAQHKAVLPAKTGLVDARKLFQTPPSPGEKAMNLHAGASGKTSAVLGTVPIGTASNAFSIINQRTNQLIADDQNDWVFFIHRQNIAVHGGTPATTSNGVFRIDYSTNGGTTFTPGGSGTIDIGPLNPIPYGSNPARGRYPQIALHRPTGTTSIDSVRLAWVGPTTSGTGWGNYNWGAVKNITKVGIGSSTSVSPYTYAGFAAPNQNLLSLIPGGLTEGLPGEFWFVDNFFNPSSERSLDSLQIWKGTLTNKGAYDEINWSLYHTIPLAGFVQRDPTDLQNGELTYFGMDMAFSPDGMHGYVFIAADYKEDLAVDTNYYRYEPLLFATHDGGATWSNTPIHISLRTLKAVMDSSETFDPGSGQIFAAQPAVGQCGLVVDNAGNPHVFTRVYQGYVPEPGPNALDSVYFISTGLAKPLFDITTYDLGQTWCPKFISYLNTFNGAIAGTDLNIDWFGQASRTQDGSHVFFTWLDDTASTDPGVLNPDLWGAAIRVNDGAQTPAKLFSDTDPTFQEKVFYPQISPVTLRLNSAPGTYRVPMAFVEIVTNDLDPVNFHYATNVTFTDAEFVVPSRDLGITPITSPSGILCGVGTTNVTVGYENEGSSAITGSFELTLYVDGPISDTIVATVTPPGGLAPGATGNYTFSSVNVAQNGTYTFRVVTEFDQLCENNQQELVSLNVGGTSGQIFANSTTTGCGSVVLDAGLQGVPTDWSWNSGASTATGQMLTLDDSNFTSGDVVTVTVTPVGCPSLSDSITVTINPLPVITVDPVVQLCGGAGDTTLLANAANPPGFTTIWTLPNGTSQPAGNSIDITKVVASSGLYNVTMTDNLTFCVSSQDVDVKVWNISLSFGSFPTDVCKCEAGSPQVTSATDCQRFLDAANSSTLSGTSFNWSYQQAGGPVVPNAGVQSGFTLFSGTYTYTVEATDPLGCNAANPATASITVTASDTLEYTAFANPPTSGITNGNYRFFTQIEDRTPPAGDALTPLTQIRWDISNGSLVACLYKTDGGQDITGSHVITTNASLRVSTLNAPDILSDTDSLYVGWSAAGTRFIRVQMYSGKCAPQFTFPTFTSTACVVSRETELASGIDLAVFPNPSGGVFNVELNLDNVGDVSLNVVDVNGREVFSQNVTRASSYLGRMDLSNLASGVYVLRVNTPNGTAVRRLVKD